MDQEINKRNTYTQLLEQLQRDFEEHRQRNPSEPYPTTLKKAAINALSHGIKPKIIRTACQISKGQFSYWKQCLGKQYISDAKVLQVIDDISEPEQIVSNQDKIELRIGHWHLTLQSNHTISK